MSMGSEAICKYSESTKDKNRSYDSNEWCSNYILNLSFLTR